MRRLPAVLIAAGPVAAELAALVVILVVVLAGR